MGGGWGREMSEIGAPLDSGQTSGCGLDLPYMGSIDDHTNVDGYPILHPDEGSLKLQKKTVLYNQ